MIQNTGVVRKKKYGNREKNMSKIPKVRKQVLLSRNNNGLIWLNAKETDLS